MTLPQATKVLQSWENRKTAAFIPEELLYEIAQIWSSQAQRDRSFWAVSADII